MDRDLEDKSNVLKIDGHNLALKETSLNLSMYHGYTPLDPALDDSKFPFSIT